MTVPDPNLLRNVYPDTLESPGRRLYSQADLDYERKIAHERGAEDATVTAFFLGCFVGTVFCAITYVGIVLLTR